MNKPLVGIPLRLFKLWLYSPLLLLAYVNYEALAATSPKVGWVPLGIGFAMTLFIAGIVLFHREFRRFDRATPVRVLACFGIIFGVTDLFIVVLATIANDFHFSFAMIKYPGYLALIFTPAMVMCLEAFLPKSDTKSEITSQGT